MVLNNPNYDIKDDVDIIRSILDLSDEELSEECNIPLSILDSIEDGEIPSNDILDRIYGYACSRGLYVNDIIWQEYQDEYENKNYLILSHGSRTGLFGDISLDVNGESNDFSNGFYCGESLTQAGMFVSSDENSSIYIIGFDSKGLKPIKFYNSNEWMLAVAYYRGKLDKYVNSKTLQRIINKVENADYVIAPIADNQIFEIIDAFASGELTDEQARFSLSATHLGFQYVFKKDVCLPKLTVLRRCYLSPQERVDYVDESNKEWRTSISKALIAKKKFADKGKYIHQILKTSVNESVDVNNFEFRNIHDDLAEDYLLQDKSMRNNDLFNKLVSYCNGEYVIDDDKLVGYVFVGDTKDKGFMLELFVNPEYRRKHVATKLVSDAIEKFGAIDLLVEKTNTKAINLYEKFGFKKVKYDNNKYYWMKLK